MIKREQPIALNRANQFAFKQFFFLRFLFQTNHFHFCFIHLPNDLLNLFERNREQEKCNITTQ